MAVAVSALCLVMTLDAVAQPDTLWTNSIRNAGIIPQVIRTFDSGFAIGTEGWGGDEDRLAPDYQIIKTDSAGTLEWQRFYPGLPNGRHAYDQGYTIAQTSDNGYILGGGGAGTAVLIRTDSEGDTLWMRYYAREEIPRPPNAMEVRIAPDDNIYVASDDVAAKVEVEDGSVIWSIEFDLDLVFTSCESIDGGGLLAAGVGNHNTFAARLDDEGNVVWQQIYEADESEGCSGVTVSTGGGWCLVGTSRYGNEPGEVYPLFIRIDDDGELIWRRVYDDWGPGHWLKDVVETPDGGFAACGSANHYYFLMRTDYSGDVLWDASYGNYGVVQIDGEARSLLPMEDGGYVLGGFTGRGLWLVRTEPDPVDLPFELELLAENYDFEAVEVDSSALSELSLANTGRRYAVIDSVWFGGDSAFACPLDLPFRIEPEDTAFVPVTFQPAEDTTYAATLFLRYGDDQAVEVTLTGEGVPPNAAPADRFDLQPQAFSLAEPFPNPFNSSVRFQFDLPEDGIVEMSFFDMNGSEVASAKRWYSAGSHTVVWRAEGHGAGVYLLRATAAGMSRTQKITLIK